MGKKKGFNYYKIFNDYAIFYVINRKKEVFEIYVDLDDLQRLIDFGLRWGVSWKPNIESYYATTTQYLGNYEQKHWELHRWIMNASEGDHVDHRKPKDTLDNRRANLRITTNDKNTKHRKGANKNNTSGYRNVSLDKNKNEWMVQLQDLDGKTKCFKRFPYGTT